MAKRDHADALDQLRAEMIRAVQHHWRVGRGRRRRDRGLWTYSALEIRRYAPRIRALDAVRGYARDRAFSAEMWMLIACGKSRVDAVREARATVAAGPEVPSL